VLKTGSTGGKPMQHAREGGSEGRGFDIKASCLPLSVLLQFQQCHGQFQLNWILLVCNANRSQSGVLRPLRSISSRAPLLPLGLRRIWDSSGVTYVWVEEFLAAPLFGARWEKQLTFLLPYSASFWEWPPLAAAAGLKLVEQAY
jgi:hypothetical protein